VLLCTNNYYDYYANHQNPPDPCTHSAQNQTPNPQLPGLMFTDLDSTFKLSQPVEPGNLGYIQVKQTHGYIIILKILNMHVMTELMITHISVVLSVWCDWRE